MPRVLIVRRASPASTASVFVLEIEAFVRARRGRHTLVGQPDAADADSRS
jgi:hypothetical protein